MVAAASPVLELVEGAPWWVKVIVAVLALVAPVVVPRIWPERKTTRVGSQEEPDEDEQDLLELRELLVRQVRRAEKAEQQAAAATAEAAAAKAEAQHLQKIVDALITRRREDPTPPRGTPPPVP